DGNGRGDAAEQNVIAGNGTGVLISGVGADQNSVAGNLIGLNAVGAAALANTTGVAVILGARSNRIGTNADGISDTTERNIISGNSGAGAALADSGTSQNIVAGNYIGTNVAGTASLANGGNGVVIQGGAATNFVGTNGDGVNDPVEQNVISGNAQSGL